MHGLSSHGITSAFKVGQPVWFKRHGSAANEPGTITEVRGWVLAVQLEGDSGGGQEILVDQIYLLAREAQPKENHPREVTTSDAKK